MGKSFTESFHTRKFTQGLLYFQMETDFYVLAELLKDYLGIVHSVKVRHKTTREIANLFLHLVFLLLLTQPETRKLHQVSCRLVALLSSSRYQDAVALRAPA